jgi:hypothetical protein
MTRGDHLSGEVKVLNGGIHWPLDLIDAIALLSDHWNEFLVAPAYSGKGGQRWNAIRTRLPFNLSGAWRSFACQRAKEFVLTGRFVMEDSQVDILPASALPDYQIADVVSSKLQRSDATVIHDVLVHRSLNAAKEYRALVNGAESNRRMIAQQPNAGPFEEETEAMMTGKITLPEWQRRVIDLGFTFRASGSSRLGFSPPAAILLWGRYHVRPSKSGTAVLKAACWATFELMSRQRPELLSHNSSEVARAVSARVLSQFDLPIFKNAGSAAFQKGLAEEFAPHLPR